MFDHPMDHPRIALLLSLLGAFGVGLSMMALDIFWPGAMICYVAGVVTISRYWSNILKLRSLGPLPKPGLETLIVTIVVMIEFIAPTFLIIKHIKSPDVTPSILQNASLKSEKNENRVLPSIYIVCHPSEMPKKMPAEGRIYALSFWDQFIFNGGNIPMGEYFGPPESDWDGTLDRNYMFTYKCAANAYGIDALFNVYLDLNIEYSIAQNKDSENPRTPLIQAGKVVLVRKNEISIGKISSDENRPFLFYLFNYSQYFIKISFPSSAKAKTGGNVRIDGIPIIEPDHIPIFLVPLPPKNPPAASLPSPAPPASLPKK